ncbi:MAG: hypothetical protein VZQ51_07205 [Bacteroidales bacterium]|nr:hypothetical protein [Bacteroidales bacterium]
MRENVKDRDRLEHIIEAIDRITSFADGKSKEQIKGLRHQRNLQDNGSE